MISNELYWLIAAVAVLSYFAWKFWPKADVNNDGKVDAADAKEAVKQVADVNKDGKVDTKDAKEAVVAVATKATKAATKVKNSTKTAPKGKVKK